MGSEECAGQSVGSFAQTEVLLEGSDLGRAWKDESVGRAERLLPGEEMGWPEREGLPCF